MTDLSEQQRLASSRTSAPAAPMRSPRGRALTCANWQIEAAYRMLQNNCARENGLDLPMVGTAGEGLG